DTNSGVLSFDSAQDFEGLADTDLNGVYEVEVTAADGNGGTDVQPIAVTVTDVSEGAIGPVSDADGSANTVAKNALVGDTVGITGLATDPDVTDTVTYSLSDDAGGLEATSDTDTTSAEAESSIGLAAMADETVELLPMDGAVLASVVADVQRDPDPNEYQAVVYKPIPPKSIDLRNLDITPFESETQQPMQMRSLMDNPSFVEGLEAMNRDLDKAVEDGDARYRLGAETVIGVSLSLSAGFVSWVLRTGSLMASFMS
ncbi:MAG: hypothetical protein GY788_09860, partial [bacterium]|nr:hypothetical protein [bacterium]